MEDPYHTDGSQKASEEDLAKKFDTPGDSAEDLDDRHRTLLDRLNEAQRIAGVGDYEWDAKKNKVTWSIGLYEIMKLDPGFEPPAFEGILKLLYEEDRHILENAVKNALAKGEPYEISYRVIRSDNSHIHLLEKSRVRTDKTGKVSHLYGTLLDITDRVQNELSLREAGIRADSANRAKSEFLANMSHEIRTPLNGIQGYLQLLQFTDLDNEQKGFVENAMHASENLITIIDDILDLSKIEAGKIVIKQHAFDPNSLFRSLKTLFTPRIKDKGLKLDIQTDQNLPAKLIGDMSRIRQILVNLVSNAIKFTDNGTVKIHTRVVDSSNDDKVALKFIVSDTGIGMPQAVVKSIFEPFIQADNSDSRNHKGTGLGLSIVQRLVDMMDGEIDIQSKEGKGTVCTVKLILGRMQQPEPEANDRNVKSKASIRSSAKGSLHVLVTEDDEYNTIVISRMLKLLGHTLERASNGIVALEMIKAHDFDLILMDLQMPQLDGFDTTARIRSDPEFSIQSSIPIIAISAHAMDFHRKECLQAGMNDFISKPIEIQAFKKVLDAYTPLDD